MYSGIAIVIILGVVRGKSELKQTQSGISICDVEVEVASNDGEKINLIPASAFGKTAEHIYNSVNINDVVVIQGSIRTREWTGADGNVRRTISIYINSIKTLFSEV